VGAACAWGAAAPTIRIKAKIVANKRVNFIKYFIGFLLFAWMADGHTRFGFDRYALKMLIYLLCAKIIQN